ncbi:MAG: hypothetical protein IJO74_05805 [Clostridia bacterium]|nr:hypothetical protein [Clostridia bacterium]
MKFNIFIILSVIFVLLASCTANYTQNNEQILPETQGVSDGAIAENLTLQNSKFIKYLSSVVSDLPAEQVNYLLKRTITVNGTTTSCVTAVDKGNIIDLKSTNGSVTADIITPTMYTSMDCINKTYSDSPIEHEVYQKFVFDIECIDKYKNIEFFPTGYTVVDKDYYAEVAVIDGVSKIFIFDFDEILKYIVYTQEDGSLVTEEIISIETNANTITSDNFQVPEDYTEILNENS